MKQITQRLVADMNWRLSPAGSRFKPSRRECESWGAAKLPWAAPILGGCASQAVMLGLAVGSFDANFFVGGFLALAVFMGAIPLAFILAGRYQKKADLTTYRKLVEQNERFALVEYGRLLQRQLQAAKSDPALGGAGEVARLTDLSSKINQSIREGDQQQPASPSGIAIEAELAASVVEAYTAGKDSGLSALDARLPEELRVRLDELDAEAGCEKTGSSKQVES